MRKKVKLGKISIVVFLTALIWVWADLAQDEELPLSGVVTVTVSNPSDPNLWVALESEGSASRPVLSRSLTFKRVVLKGPASRVADVERRINRKELTLDLFVIPDQMGLTEATSRTFDAVSFLRESKEMRQLGLTVEASEPATFTVQARRLAIEDVAVECLDAQSGNRVATESIEPLRVKARVPVEGIVSARVLLTADEQKQAREAAVSKTPYIELPDGRRDALQQVKIKLPPAGDTSKPYSVPATLGFCLSQNMQGKYQVVLDGSLPAHVVVRATQAAQEEYSKQLYQMILYIDDEDKPGQDYSRSVAFTFPQEYVRRGEIRLGETQPAVEVKFHLVPIAPPPAAAAPVGEITP
jgi:hypothetical protein